MRSATGSNQPIPTPFRVFSNLCNQENFRPRLPPARVRRERFASRPGPAERHDAEPPREAERAASRSHDGDRVRPSARVRATSAPYAPRRTPQLARESETVDRQSRGEVSQTRVRATWAPLGGMDSRSGSAMDGFQERSRVNPSTTSVFRKENSAILKPLRVPLSPAEGITGERPARNCPPRAATSGDRRGQHAIRVNDQWRICFVGRDGDPHEVEFVDYH
jgi:hypothetical protein